MKWADGITALFAKHAKSITDVADLGCGTGGLTIPLAERGYDMTGIDISEDMLALALEKAGEKKLNILFLNQDICSFELYGTVDAFVCVCDTVNHILEPSELVEMMRLVGNYLNPGGLFIFDINSPAYFEQLAQRGTYADTTDRAAYICETRFSHKDQIMEFDLSFFVADGASGGEYKRFNETNYERVYTLDEVKGYLSLAGLDFVAVYDDCFEIPQDNAERLFTVARKS